MKRFYPGDKVIIQPRERNPIIYHEPIGIVVDLEYENHFTIYAVSTMVYDVETTWLKEEVIAVYADQLIPYNETTKVLFLPKGYDVKF